MSGQTLTSWPATLAFLVALFFAVVCMLAVGDYGYRAGWEDRGHHECDIAE